MFSAFSSRRYISALQVLGRKDPEIVEAGTTLGDMAVLDQAYFSFGSICKHLFSTYSLLMFLLKTNS